jgi:restriction system protein
MDNANANMWGIHAGKTGDADELFFKNSCIALGWGKVPDLSKLPADREAFKDAVARAYPDKPRAVPVNGGQLYRFVHEMKRGDLVVYPSKRDRQIHLARVDGDYRFNNSLEPTYPHQRSATWLREVPRTHFTQGALYEIGAAMSLFLVQKYVDEYQAVLEGAEAPVTHVSSDETVAAVTEDVEETTKDFVLKRLAQEAKGEALESVIAHLLECMGYHARLTRKNEPSVDVIAHKDHLGLEPPIIKVQVKSGEGVVSDRDVSALYGKLSSNEYGLFVTLGTFSPPSLQFERSKSNLRLIDGEELVELIFHNYEKFDARYKGLLPLRRVYVPEQIDLEGDG